MNEEEIKAMAKDIDLIIGGNYQIDCDLTSIINDVLKELKNDPNNDLLKKIAIKLCTQRVYITVQSILILESREDKKDKVEEMRVLLNSRIEKAKEVNKFIESLGK